MTSAHVPELHPSHLASGGFGGLSQQRLAAAGGRRDPRR
jgi:hypothetical protein